MGKSRRSLGSILLATLDLGVIDISYRLSFYIRFDHNVPNLNWYAYIRILPFVFAATVLSLYVFNLYNGLINKNVLGVLYSLLLALFFVTVVIMGYSYISQSSALPRSIALIMPLFEFILFAGLRIVVLRLLKRMYGSKKVLLVGNSSYETMQMIKKFVSHNSNQFLVLDKVNEGEIQTKLNEADIVAMSSGIEDKMKIINLCMKKGKEVLLVPDLMGILVYSAETQYIDDTLMFTIKSPGLTIGQRFVKRAFDLTVAFLMLLVATPIMILLMILIPLLSPGSPIFIQERLGERGRPFKIMKFRSMVNNAERKTGPVLAAEKDPRITKFGAFIRTTRLDELPQLFNVVKGDMSIVGPRPERKFFIDQFMETIPYYSYRMMVKPGITGFAQVKGKYTTTPEDKLRFDLMYIRNYSFGLDLSILLQTTRVLFQREKATGVASGKKFNIA